MGGPPTLKDSPFNATISPPIPVLSVTVGDRGLVKYDSSSLPGEPKAVKVLKTRRWRYQLWFRHVLDSSGPQKRIAFSIKWRMWSKNYSRLYRISPHHREELLFLLTRLHSFKCMRSTVLSKNVNHQRWKSFKLTQLLQQLSQCQSIVKSIT